VGDVLLSSEQPTKITADKINNAIEHLKTDMKHLRGMHDFRDRDLRNLNLTQYTHYDKKCQDFDFEWIS
ncbi:MAG: hypothetical protein JSU69_11135, partial [Candidatus Zixiibacteriota bacterium]